MSQQVMTIHGVPVHWDDGTWGVIEAKDLPPGCPRSKTNKTVGDAVKSTSWDPGLTTAPGPKSANDFVKVRLADLATKAPGPLAYRGVVSKPKVVVDDPPEKKYPHKCPTCGGRMLILFTSIEHEGGECPGPQKPKMRWR